MKRIFARLQELLEKKQDAVLAVITAAEGSTPRGAGAAMLVTRDGLLAGTIGGGALERLSIETARELIRSQKSAFHEFDLQGGGQEATGMVCGGKASVFFQYINASDPSWAELADRMCEALSAGRQGSLLLSLDGSFPSFEEGKERLHTSPVLSEGQFALPVHSGERAVLFGAGHCAAALAPILHSVGFRVFVLDDREELLTRERFPHAEERICWDYGRISEHLLLEEDDYIVIMTSGHVHDCEVEEQVLRMDFPYVGVIGSRKKTAVVNARLREKGISEEKLQSVHTPIGLAIDAVTPEEIAVSIAAEMIQVRARRRG